MPRSVHDAWSQMFDVGKDILSAEADPNTGAIIGQIGNATDSTADSDRFELWGPPGYYAVPAPPTAGQPSCQAVALRCGDHDIVIGTRDPRDAKAIGNLKPGDRAWCAGFPGQGRLYLRADGSVCLLTKDDNTPTGNDVYFRVEPEEMRFWSPWGSQVHDHSGWHLRTFHGAKLDLGGLGLPAPFSSFGSFANLTAAIIRINAPVVQLGQDSGNSQALAKVTTLATQLALVTTALADLATAVGAFTGSGTFPGLAAAVTAIGAAATAMAGLPATCGTTTVTAA